MGDPKISLSEIVDLNERLDAGSVVPSGECPKCEALCYPVRKPNPVQKSERAQIMVIMEGGMIQSILSNVHVECVVIDYDCDEEADGKGPGAPHPPADLLRDALEVVLWHQFFITVKLKRAFHSLVNEKEEPHDWPRDSEGTAKVVLIGVDRCIAAWAAVRGHLPEHGNAALDFMLRLDRLRNKVEAEFPKARAFVRPGFDQQPPG